MDVPLVAERLIVGNWTVFVIGTVAVFLLWLSALVHAATTGRWPWLAAMIFLAPVAVPLYALVYFIAMPIQRRSSDSRNRR